MSNTYLFTDDELNILLEFISGKGVFSFFGGSGIHTYPNADDRAKIIYAACCELERRGLVRRVEDRGDYVWFRAANK